MKFTSNKQTVKKRQLTRNIPLTSLESGVYTFKLLPSPEGSEFAAWAIVNFIYSKQSGYMVLTKAQCSRLEVLRDTIFKAQANKLKSKKNPYGVDLMIKQRMLVQGVQDLGAGMFSPLRVLALPYSEWVTLAGNHVKALFFKKEGDVYPHGDLFNVSAPDGTYFDTTGLILNVLGDDNGYQSMEVSVTPYKSFKLNDTVVNQIVKFDDAINYMSDEEFVTCVESILTEHHLSCLTYKV